MKLQQFIQQNKTFSYQQIKDKELATHIQQILAWHKILESKPDGRFGRISTYALAHFQKIHQIKESFLGAKTAKALINTHPDRTASLMASTRNNFLDKVVEAMKRKGFKLFTQRGEVNIVYVEGVNPDFTLNADTPNVFNDLCVVFSWVNGKPKLLGKWVATTDPGRYYTDNPMNSKGALHHNGQATAWRVGWHKTHEALVQVKPITVTRDYNRDFRTDGDKEDRGYFGANCHGSKTNNLRDIGRWSAGCKVIFGMRQQAEFMGVVKNDVRYRQNKNHFFTVATVDGTSLLDIDAPSSSNNSQPITQEMEILAKTIWGEGRGESREGKIAIASTVLNRYKISQTTPDSDWWGNSIIDICLKPWQYSCWNKSDPNRAKIERLDRSDSIYSECLKIARGVILGTIPDNTLGATHYFNFYLVRPSWASKMQKLKTIGNHVFYK